MAESIQIKISRVSTGVLELSEILLEPLLFFISLLNSLTEITLD